MRPVMVISISVAMLKLVSLIVVICAASQVQTLENGLARTPPMGWMSWQRFRCVTDCKNYPDECISEKLFKTTADFMVSEGYLDAGYEYLIIDDCWLDSKRDEKTQKLVADPERFPNGIKAVSDYVHSKGLKFGLYEDYGTHTCAGYPGVINHMELDAQTFAEWGVDYVKLDGCNANVDDMDKGYPEFGRFLNKTGRPMVYSCSWPAYQEGTQKQINFEALKEHCNLWRNYGDIDDSFDSVVGISGWFGNNQDQIQQHAGPGHWNDPDMLLLGNYGLSFDQSKSQMALWSILAAPLLMSTDMRYIKPEIKAILQNREVLTISQDPLGIQGRRVHINNAIETWTRPVLPVIKGEHHHSYAVAFVSHRTDGTPYPIAHHLKTFGLKNQNGYQVIDLFDKTAAPKLYKPNDVLKTRINPSGVQFYKFTVVE